MSKKSFNQQVKEMESDGWQLVEYEPRAKHAVFVKGSITKVVG
jgi:hypothetical protein